MNPIATHSIPAKNTEFHVGAPQSLRAITGKADLKLFIGHVTSERTDLGYPTYGIMTASGPTLGLRLNNLITPRHGILGFALWHNGLYEMHLNVYYHRPFTALEVSPRQEGGFDIILDGPLTQGVDGLDEFQRLKTALIILDTSRSRDGVASPPLRVHDVSGDFLDGALAFSFFVPDQSGTLLLQ